MLADKDAPVRPLLDGAAVAEAGADANAYRSATELVLGLDTWLRRYGTTLEL
ncbi:hypothetical protein [Streptomyces sp. ISL-11]|uniref:hypothetical protein n=1 Tax=Streptomyces sp. ISL-11 TaxID=2819174 RepID=UPI001BEB8623|nr:hypothetical protein [Streptomyces sp. ISL-11]MBT2386150.1 hypothetical protein [Streptomyces sp. ISL-11]